MENPWTKQSSTESILNRNIKFTPISENPASDWFSPHVQPPGLLERGSAGVRIGAELLSGGGDALVDVGAGIAGSIAGIIPAVSSLVGEKLRGGDGAAAYSAAMEKYSAPITRGIQKFQEFATGAPKNRYGAASSELAGRGLETGLHAVKAAANIEGDLYKDIGLTPVEKNYPAAAKILGLIVELATFKAVHSLGAAAKQKLLSRRIKIEELKNKPVQEWAQEDANFVNDLRIELKKAKRSENVPAEIKDLIDPDIIEAEFTVQKIQRLLAPQKQLEAPRNLLEAPQEQVVPSVQKLNKAQPIVIKPTTKRSVRASEKTLGSKIRIDSIMEQTESAPWHEFTFMDGPAEGASFTVMKYGKVLKADIVKSGQKVLDQYKPKEKLIESEEKVTVNSLLQPIIDKYPESIYDARNTFIARVRQKLNLNDKQVEELFLNDDYTKIAMPEIDRRFKAGEKDFIGLANQFADKIGARMNEGKLRVTEKPKVEPIERRVDELGDTKLTKKELPKLKEINPQEALVELRNMVDDVVKFTKDPESINIEPIYERIKTIAQGLDPKSTLSSDALMATDRMLVEIHKSKGGERFAEEIRKNTKEVSTEEGIKGEDKGQIHVRELAENRVETSEEITVPRVKEGLELLRERQAALRERGRIKPSKMSKEELKETLRERDNLEVFNEELQDSGLSRREKKEYAKEKYEQIGEEYKDLYNDNYDLGDYSLGKLTGDLYDVFIKGEKGAFSVSKMNAEKIQKLHKIWRKSKDMGRELGEYLKEIIPELTDEQVQKLEKFIQEHFIETKKPFDIGGEQILEPGRSRKVGEFTVNKPDYVRSWYDNWKNNSKVFFSKVTAGHYGTTARAFFEQVPWLAEELYYPWRKAVKVAKINKRNMRDNFLKPLKKLVPDKAGRRRIRDYAIVQQLFEKGKDGKMYLSEGAQEFMEVNNIKAIPKLTAKELQVYEGLRLGFERLYDDINIMRAANGLTPFKKVEDYFTFLRAVSAIERVGLGGELMSQTPSFIMKEYARMKETPFRFKRARAKDRKYRLSSEPFDIFETYADLAYNHMAVSPIVAKARAMTKIIKDPLQTMTKKGRVTDRKFNPFRGKNSRDAAQYVTEWAHKVSGVPMKHEMPPRVRGVLNKLNSNLATSILGASLRAVLIQPMALVGTFANIGMKYTVKGLYDLPNITKYRNARLKSDVLYSRTPDASFADNLGKIGDLKISEFPRVARNISFKGLELFDNLTAHATWNGAYAQAIAGKVPRGRGKMSEAQAIRYADDVVIRTQGSGAPGELAPIQYTSLGKTVTMFQTFVINNWNFLAYDALGLKPSTTIGEALPKIARYVFAATATNYLYEDVIGMKSPMGRPIKALMDGVEDGSNGVDIFIDVMGELVEPIPILGSARYGSTPLGPLAERLGEVYSGGKYGVTPKKEIQLMIDKGRTPTNLIELAGNLTGVPGTGQVMKTTRGLKRGETPWGSVIGTYSKKKKKSPWK